MEATVSKEKEKEREFERESSRERGRESIGSDTELWKRDTGLMLLVSGNR